MAGIFVGRVLEEWSEAEADDGRRVAVCNRLMWAGEHTEQVIAMPAAGHPLRRHLAVPNTGLVLVFRCHTKPPLFGLELVAIARDVDC